MAVDPRELEAGYSFARGRGVASYRGVLRDGKRAVWTCPAPGAPGGHSPHLIPGLAAQCAQGELERRLQGAEAVVAALHCRPCWVFWDLRLASQPGPDPGEDEASHLLRGLCPRCTGPGEHVKIAVLERSAR